MRSPAAVVLAAAALAAAPVAAAETAAQVRVLAARAARDPAALAQLERIRVVDGRPVDLRAALGGASGPELRARLHELAAPQPGAAPGRLDAGAAARSILRERRFRVSDVPRPLHGVLAWLGRGLHRLSRPLARLARHFPGGEAVGWFVLAAAAVGLTALVAVRVGRRRAGRLSEQVHARSRGRELDPVQLEREADAAEARGDLELALRLRFRAGLLRLGRADVIPRRDSLTNAEARRLLHSPEFDRLSRDFDDVVYGGEPADPERLAEARACWPRVLEDARR